MHVEVALLLFVLALGALVVPWVAPRLGIPEAVGQIVFGMVAGGLGLGSFLHGDAHGAQAALDLLAELGFILLMFGAGMEIDFDAVERGGVRGVLRGLGIALGVVGMSAVLAFTFGFPPFYVVVLSATSIGLGVVVLRETGLAAQPVGQSVLLVGGIGELLTLVAMTVFYVVHEVGVSLQMVLELAEMAALFAVGGVVLRFLKAWTWWHPGIFARVFVRHDTSEIGVRAALVACLGFVLLAVVFGVDPVLGAFIAGAVLRMVFRDVEQLEPKMSALSSGFFIPIFFIWVGLTFDLTSLSWSGLASAGLLAALVLVARLVPCAVLAADRNLGVREALGTSLLLAAPLTLLVAIAKLGEQLGVLDEAAASDLVLLAVLLSVALPVLFRRLMKDEAVVG